MSAAQPGEVWTPSAVQQERDAFRAGVRCAGARSRRCRPCWCSALLVVVAVSSPGWDRVKAAYFDVDYAKSVFPGLAEAFWLNIKIFMVAEVLILVVALVVALIRVAPSPAMAPLKLIAIIYTDVFRGTPTLLVDLPGRLRRPGAAAAGGADATRSGSA